MLEQGGREQGLLTGANSPAGPPRLPLRPGDVLCRQGGPPGPAFLVLSGEVRVYREPSLDNPTELELIRLGPGSLIGEMSVLAGGTRTATVQATREGEVLIMTIDTMRALIGRNPALARVLTTSLMERGNLSAKQVIAIAQESSLTLPHMAELLTLAAEEEKSAAGSSFPHDPALVYPKAVTCPACGTTFLAPIPRGTRVLSGERDTDFLQRYKGPPNPYDYEILVCPKDLYASMEADFRDLRPEQRLQVSPTVEAVVRGRWGGHRFSFEVPRDLTVREKALQLALAVYRMRGAALPRMAGIQHRLAWAARERDDVAGEQRWMAEAVESYRAAYGNGDLAGPKSEVTVMYLAGELARRLGDYRASVEAFWQVLRHPAIKQFPVWERMTREQMALARSAALAEDGAPPAPAPAA